MPITVQRESTEYVYIGVTGAVPATGVETAFLTAGTRPTTEWDASILVNNSGHSLWDEAVASGATGTYFIARLIGSFGGTGEVLSAGDYQVWVRITDTTERPVLIAPVVLTIG